MSYLVPTGSPLLLPKGTVREEDAKTWALYYNPYVNSSWLVYGVPAGLNVTRLPGHYSLQMNISNLSGFVSQRQATACCDGK